MSVRTKICSFLGFFAGGLLSIFSKQPTKAAPDDLSKAEFKTSSQRLGVRFTEQIRKVFRFRWLRKF